MHPSYFNQSHRGHLGNELRRQVEGTCSGRLGYIVAVVLEEMDSTGSHRGRIMEDGQAVFSIKYRAVVYRPFRNEVVDGVVSSVNKVRLRFSLWCQTSCQACRKPDPLAASAQMGIFVDVGPLQCFISTHVSLQREDERAQVLTVFPDDARSWSRQTLALIPIRTRLASRARKTR